LGTFQLPPARGDVKSAALSAALVDYVMSHHMPQAAAGAAAADDSKEYPPALAMLRETVVGSGRCCTPRYRMPCNSRNEGSKYVG
jgi:hypothetical protein